MKLFALSRGCCAYNMLICRLILNNFKTLCSDVTGERAQVTRKWTGSKEERSRVDNASKWITREWKTRKWTVHKGWLFGSGRFQSRSLVFEISQTDYLQKMPFHKLIPFGLWRVWNVSRGKFWKFWKEKFRKEEQFLGRWREVIEWRFLRSFKMIRKEETV